LDDLLPMVKIHGGAIEITRIRHDLSAPALVAFSHPPAQAAESDYLDDHLLHAPALVGFSIQCGF
ncbi:MAG TPA: hypothetical protein P5572_16470, partial [Phycisphaerae bacterium]|nr:hypothetical protein [Phycisphaerae bacterium]